MHVTKDGIALINAVKEVDLRTLLTHCAHCSLLTHLQASILELQMRGLSKLGTTPNDDKIQRLAHHFAH